MSAMHAGAVTLFLIILKASNTETEKLKRVIICEYVIYACNSDRHRKQITVVTASTLH